ncbi:hypothetical protein BK659_15550 [Pseudomonas brassicacearum]|uniref:Uncharacterized protein n=1 Tax=Pseudomonas brassicacearum TaxID=930166 RepID=A0A423H6F3_9PSED|nr:hypothetical protein [Pseudomonas brassicacearum]RON08781.1 hypothetical protein BK659_15550 [Pseudomonas brassicacearum]
MGTDAVCGDSVSKRAVTACTERQHVNAGQLAEPILIAHEGEGALSLQQTVLDPAQNRAVLNVGPYPGMACGDKLVLSWSGIDADGAAYLYKTQRFVSNAQVGKDIVFVVRAPHIAALDGGSLEVYYTLSNAELSGPVESRRLQLEVGDVRQELLVAQVDDAIGGWLAPVRVAEGTKVSIRPYARMAVGDTVFLSWVGNMPDHGFSDSLRIEQFAVGSEISFWIDPHYITANLGSAVTFSYFVEHPGQAIRYSEQAQVMIGVRELLPLAIPDVLEADEGELDVRDALDGVTVVIDGSGVEQGELVYLKCDGTYFSHRDNIEVSDDSAIVFIVPYRFWREHQDSTVRVSYSVERLDDVSQASEVLEMYVRSGDLPL